MLGSAIILNQISDRSTACAPTLVDRCQKCPGHQEVERLPESFSNVAGSPLDRRCAELSVPIRFPMRSTS